MRLRFLLSQIIHGLLYITSTVVLLFSVPAYSGPLCSALFNSNVTMGPLDGAKFLHQRDPMLHTTSQVLKQSFRDRISTGKAPKNPVEKIGSWISYLEALSDKIQANPQASRRVKKVLYQHYIIKPNEVPESYFQQQVRIAQEQGHGEIQVSYAQRRELINTLIKDQKESLDIWVDYLISKDSSQYPTWLKYWMLTGLVKLSKFDLETGKFGNRGKDTVSPFPELNREALALVAELVLKKLDKQFLNNLDDPSLITAIEGGNFGRIYGQVIKSLGGPGTGRFATNEGQWVTFKKGSDPTPLVASLAGKNTGWCTAGLETARTQLSKGDFHVFYSKDEVGRATIPRVAIRMEDYAIGEVRGVAKEQNLDPQIVETSIVTKKLAEFGSEGSKYSKKSEDMKRLTLIANKNKVGAELDPKELGFLYEIDEEIVGFGWQKDPRIEEILKSRKNKVKDLATALYCAESEISFTVDEALRGGVKHHFGDLRIDAQSLAPVALPEVVRGDVSFYNLKSLEGVVLPKIVKGNLHFSFLEDAHGVKLPEEVGGDISFWSLRSIDGLVFPRTINGSLYLAPVQSAIGTKLPSVVKGDVTLRKLESAAGLILPEVINGDLQLTSLQSYKGMKWPRRIDGTITVYDKNYPYNAETTDYGGRKIYDYTYFTSYILRAKNFLSR